MTDTPDTPDPNKPEEPKPDASPAPIQPPSQQLPAFFQIPIPVNPAAATPTNPPQQVIPGVMSHPDLSNMVEISALAGGIQLLIRPSGTWMRVPCEWVPALVTQLEAARDAAALMRSAIDTGTAKVGKRP